MSVIWLPVRMDKKICQYGWWGWAHHKAYQNTTNILYHKPNNIWCTEGYSCEYVRTTIKKAIVESEKKNNGDAPNQYTCNVISRIYCLKKLTGHACNRCNLEAHIPRAYLFNATSIQYTCHVVVVLRHQIKTDILTFPFGECPRSFPESIAM